MALPRIRLYALMLLWAALAESQSFAQDAASTESPQVEQVNDAATEAQVEFELGVDDQNRRQYRSALSHYLASHRLSPNANVIFNAAVCAEALGLFAEAFRYYELFLSSAAPADHLPATEALTRLSQSVALIRVESSPPGATVYLDRLDLGARGQTPLVLPVPPGPHRVLLRLPRHRPVDSTEFVATVGAEVRHFLPLEASTGAIQIDGAPDGAEVLSQSRVIARLPGRFSLPLGSRQLEVRANGFLPVSLSVDVRENTTTTARVDLRPIPGSVLVRSNAAEALIEVDGVAQGIAPLLVRELTPGVHAVSVTAEGFYARTEQVTVQSNAQVEARIDLRSTEEVTTASRRPELLDDAPLSLSLITEEEIRGFGYQTLAEAVRDERGMFLSDDGTYTSLGIRGMSRPQDYGNRMQVLVSGHSSNDDLIGSSYVGFDARTDLGDIERIELARGPASITYGTGAFFGAVNMVTHGQRSIPRPGLSIAAIDQRGLRTRLGGGLRFGENAGLWASAAFVGAQGRDNLLGESSPSGANGWNAMTAAARGFYGDFELELQFHRRRSRIGTGAFDSILGDPRAEATDNRGFLELRYQHRVAAHALSARVYSDVYVFRGSYPYSDAEGGESRDAWNGALAGLDIRDDWQVAPWLLLSAGVEGRHSLLGELSGERDLDPATGAMATPHLDLTVAQRSVGAHLNVHTDIAGRVLIDLGARYDLIQVVGNESQTNHAVSPRVAVVVRPWTNATIKLLGGGAFRSPSAYELHYHDGGLTQRAPAVGTLSPERMWSGEIDLSQRLGAYTLSAHGYYNHTIGLIRLVPEDDGILAYRNETSPVQTVGGEFEARRSLRHGAMFAVSYSVQHSRVGHLISGERLTNSPLHAFAARGLLPISAPYLIASGKLRVESPRSARNERDELVLGTPIVLLDCTVTGDVPTAHLHYAFGIRNLLDWRFGTPAGTSVAATFIEAQGRTFFAELGASF